MPWKETCRMEERARFVHAFEAEEEPTLSEVCRRFGVSRKTGYKWLERYRRGGLLGLADLPSVARRQPRRLSAELEDVVVELRKERSRWGPKKLRAVLAARQPEVEWPATSTIGEVLKRRGLIRPRKRRVAVLRGGTVEGICTKPNEVWCDDFKGAFSLGDGSRCHPFTVTDLCSRFILKCQGMPSEKGAGVQAELTKAFEEFGMPDRLRSDNGPPFGAQAPGGFSRIAVWLMKIGVVPEFITPGAPQENGEHERMHRTLKEETAKPPKATQAEQQQAFDHFRRDFNEVRPHEALGQVPPKKRYEPSSKSYTGKLSSPEYVDCEVRWANNSGRVSFRGKGFSVGSPLAKEPVGFTQIADDLFEVKYGPIRLGFFCERDDEPRLRCEPPKGTEGPSAPETAS